MLEADLHSCVFAFVLPSLSACVGLSQSEAAALAVRNRRKGIRTSLPRPLKFWGSWARRSARCGRSRGWFPAGWLPRVCSPEGHCAGCQRQWAE